MTAQPVIKAATRVCWLYDFVLYIVSSGATLYTIDGGMMVTRIN